MEKEKSTSDIVFALFLDAVKRRDKMQFAYYNLYSNIAHSEELENTEKEPLEM